MPLIGLFYLLREIQGLQVPQDLQDLRVLLDLPVQRVHQDLREMTDLLVQRDQPEQVVQREAPVLQAPPVEPDLRVQQRGSEHQQQAQGLLVLLQVDPIRLKYLLSQYRQGRQDQQVQQVRRDLRARLAQPPSLIPL